MTQEHRVLSTKAPLGSAQGGERSVQALPASDPVGGQTVEPATPAPGASWAPRIDVSHATSGFDDISTVYAYYTPTEKASHGKHCEYWTEFGHRPETAPYKRGGEREFCLKIEAENPGRFSHFLISWSNCN